MEDLDIFGDDDGVLERPTMRGNANLNIQDYQGGSDGGDLLDELSEDIPSTPGSGAASATDVEGTDDFLMSDDDGDSPGMEQTTYGNHPWGPGSGSGYQPMSMRTTDLSGDSEPVPMPSRQTQSNREPSNRGVDPLTVYDRESFEMTGSEQNIIGTGIFDNEEGVTWRARDGAFSHKYALPAYIADEDELDLQQSDMWDSVADNWRVTQPSGGGVTFARRVQQLKPRSAYSPFASNAAVPAMRPEDTGPRSHVEAFGRKAAAAVVEEAKALPPGERGAFLQKAADSLGPKMAESCKKTAERLIQLGHKPETALEDALAHCVMHATVEDLTKGKGKLPRLDKMSARVKRNARSIQGAAKQHLTPLVQSTDKLKQDLSALQTSPAAAGMGEVAAEAAATTTALPSVFTPTNMLIGAAVVGGAYLLLTKTDQGKKIQRNARRQLRKATRQLKRQFR